MSSSHRIHGPDRRKFLQGAGSGATENFLICRFVKARRAGRQTSAQPGRAGYQSSRSRAPSARHSSHPSTCVGSYDTPAFFNSARNSSSNVIFTWCSR
jgi:hypothetical protein